MTKTKLTSKSKSSNSSKKTKPAAKRANGVPDKAKVLRDKQKLFIAEYCIDLNATQAAIRAGYSEKTAYSIGHENLRKPEIRKEIDMKLSELAMGAEECTKIIGDIARGNLADYFVTKKVERSPKIQVPLKQIIAEKQAEYDFEAEYVKLVNLTGDELEGHEKAQMYKMREIIRLKLELKHNPHAFRIVPGPAQLVEDVVLDMKKLVEDKERGRIKAITPTEFGLKVELYGADSALRDIGKIHGIFEKDNEQKTVNIRINGQPINRAAKA